MKVKIKDYEYEIIEIEENSKELSDCYGLTDYNLCKIYLQNDLNIILKKETLIHELLHCKYNWLNKDYQSHDSAYYDTLEHGLLEQMSKTLLMVKYDLDFKWFEN